jgi:hypothetical protein
MYKLHDITPKTAKPFGYVERLSDNAQIPFDPDNADYAEYLKWLAEGNEPLPSDEQNGQNTPSI